MKSVKKEMDLEGNFLLQLSDMIIELDFFGRDKSELIFICSSKFIQKIKKMIPDFILGTSGLWGIIVAEAKYNLKDNEAILINFIAE